MDASRFKILPVEARSGSNQVNYSNNTTKLLPQFYMLNLNNSNSNNPLRSSSETTANANSLTSTSQLLSSMLQATTATTNSSIPTNPSIESATSTLTFIANNVTHHHRNHHHHHQITTTTTLISNFSTIDLLIVTVLITLILVSIIGNCLVCVAIFTDRRLRKLGNAFIVSLAIADLFVSCLVMTFALCNDLMNYWIFGDWFCDVWISFDIMCCTASILNLCAISLDRFIHIKDCLLYNQWMTRKVAISAVIIIWFISALVSFVPINLGWHKPDHHFGGGVGTSPSSSIASLVSAAKQVPLPESRHQHQYQQPQQHPNHHRPTRNRRRAPNESTVGAFQLQLQHSTSKPSGTLITTSERATNNGFRFRESAKLDYLSTKQQHQHVEFPLPFNNNNEQQTAEEPPIEPIENQSSSYLMTNTSRSQLANHLRAPMTTKSTANNNNNNNHYHQLSQPEDSSAASFDDPPNRASQINRTGRARKRRKRRRRKRDLVSSYNGNNESKEEKKVKEVKQDGLLNLASSSLPEMDSSGRFINKRHHSQPTFPTFSQKGNLLLPGQQQTTSPQSNKVESNPLDRSQIELDPPKAWLLEIEREAARKAISLSSKATSNTSRRQLNLQQPSSAALKLSRLPELSDEDRDGNGYREEDEDDDGDDDHDQAANNNIDLIGRQLISQDKQSQPVLTSTPTPTITDSLTKLSHPNIQSEAQQNHPQLPVCILTLTPTYAVISSTISFYIPCIIMLGLYTKLFACARKHVRNIQAISKAPAPISVRTATTTTNTSQRSSPGASDALAQHPQLELEILANENNRKDCKGSRCNRQNPRGRFHGMPKISMLECSLPAANPMKTWLKFGRKQQHLQQQQQHQQHQLQEETGGRLEKIGKNYSNAQLYDKSRFKKDAILSHRNGAKELVVSNESPGNDELVELARFTMSNKADISASCETQQKQQSKSQKQLTETLCKPVNDLNSCDISINDQQRPSLSAIKTQQDRKQQQQQQQQHCNAIAEERHSEVAKRMQMPQLDHKRQLPDEKNGKNNSRKSLISSEVERMATLALNDELVEEEHPFLASSQEVNNNNNNYNNNNNKRTRSLKQPTTCTSQLPLNSTKMINFSNQTNYQQQQQQQSGQLATHKAAITLGIIMGTFLFCWVPFFCLNITKAFCVDCIPSSVFRFFTWLGYANSALNPIIYGIHNSEFRCAFNRIFFKHLNIKNSRYYLNRRFSYDLRQQSVHNNHSGSQKSFRGKKDRQKIGAEINQSFKSCKAEPVELN